jgi:hypothetical protein
MVTNEQKVQAVGVCILVQSFFTHGWKQSEQKGEKKKKKKVTCSQIVMGACVFVSVSLVVLADFDQKPKETKNPSCGVVVLLNR